MGGTDIKKIKNLVVTDNFTPVTSDTEYINIIGGLISSLGTSVTIDFQTFLDAKENISNKATNFSTLDNTLYPTTQAVATYVTGFGYLSTSVASTTYQPLAANLTSWSSVTRASGFDTFTSTPSSANLLSLMTNKTGTGLIVFATSPTFTNWLTVPRIYGGTNAGDGIDYYSTSGNGTISTVAHRFLGGNNGATTLLTILNDGTIRIPNNRVIQGTDSAGTNRSLITWSSGDNITINGRLGITDIVINPTSGGLGMYIKGVTGDGSIGVASPSARWHVVKTSEQLRLGYDVTNYVSYTVGSLGGLTIAPSTAASGAVTNYTFTKPNNTNQTASTAIVGVNWNLGSRQWLTGNIGTQKEFELTSPTYSFVGASTITNAYSLYVNAPTAGTNATITNSWAAGFFADSATTSIGGSGTSSVIKSAGSFIYNTGGSASHQFQINGSLKMYIQSSNTTFYTAAATSGSTSSFTWTAGSNTNQTASTEINGYLYNSYFRTCNTGNITTQRERYYKTVTYNFVAPSTITNAYGAYFEAPTAGTNATITNNYAAGFVGRITATGNINSEVSYLLAGANAFDYSSTTLRIGVSSVWQSLELRTNGVARLTLSTTDLTFSDTYNIILGSTTGTKIGTSTTQKIGFWNATPIVQPTTSVTAATFAANTSGIANDTATFDGYTIGQVVKALRNTGLLA